MKLTDISEFKYTPPKIDLSNFFKVEEITNKDGSVSTFYNLNEGVVINGVKGFENIDSYSYTVKYGDNLKLISYKKYGNIDYWWLIAKINGISDVLENLEVGSKLYLLGEEHMKLIYNYIVRDR